MATGPQHYAEAERLLGLTQKPIPDSEFGWMARAQAAAEAQVHATLAVAPGDDSLREQVDGLREAVRSLSDELAAAFVAIGVLEERLHDHVQTVPHAEAQS